ncbi:MAG: cache and HAMP domain-containing protein, partial [Clostridiales bacterium]|nr:cache and HAMP domain-containing protein [Clostridiales bacterium]
MRISAKLFLPMTALVALSLAIVGTSSYMTAKSEITSFAENEILTVAANTVNQMNLADQTTEVIINKFGEKNLALARAFAEIVAENEDKLYDHNFMQSTAELLGADEVLVIDEEGIIIAGNIEEYINNFDMDSGEQSKEFMKIVDDPSFELAQAPQMNTYGSGMFQYAGVARKDARGLVQIGVSVSVIDELTRLSNAQSIVSQQTVGGNGFVAVVKDGVFIAHTDDSQSGQAAPEWTQTLAQYPEEAMQINIDGEDYFATSYMARSGEQIIATITEKEVKDSIKWLLGITILSILVSSTLMAFIIRLVTAKIVLKPIRKMVSAMREVSKGNLSVDTRSNVRDEIGELGNELYQVTEIFNTLIEEIQDSASKFKVGDIDNRINIERFK